MQEQEQRERCEGGDPDQAVCGTAVWVVLREGSKGIQGEREQRMAKIICHSRWKSLRSSVGSCEKEERGREQWVDYNRLG